jgi:hypothetical protein
MIGLENLVIKHRRSRTSINTESETRDSSVTLRATCHVLIRRDLHFRDQPATGGLLAPAESGFESGEMTGLACLSFWRDSPRS